MCPAMRSCCGWSRAAGHSRAPIPKSTNAASPTDFQVYVVYQFAFGPEFFHAPGNWFGHR